MHWRLITTWDAAPGWNMALDEALLLAASAVPVLRFYTWSPDTLSLGYFQRIADVPAALAHQAAAIDAEPPASFAGPAPGALVRRLTGGGAIHHTGELTFSIVAPANHPLYRGPVGPSYDRVHGAIAAALSSVGVEASPRGDAALHSDVESTGMCFHKSASVDLVWGERKGVGSAQRRKGGHVLHHGSIKLAPTRLESGVATVEQESGTAISPEAFAPRLLDAFSRDFGAKFTPSIPTAAERDAAHDRAPFFRSKTFVERR
ncbi:MAG: lipoate-protein ligase A [Bacteroidia bacterium]|jgi:lipoate-protein ligase A